MSSVSKKEPLRTPRTQRVSEDVESERPLDSSAVVAPVAVNKKTECTVCHHRCVLPLNAYGFCGVRQNVDGRIINHTYPDKTHGVVSSLALDPIEKKPLYRYFPGSKILSVGSLGCNMACSFCQNYHIAQAKGNMDKLARQIESYTPSELVELAVQTKSKGNIGIAFTYNEPLINYEFIIDCGKRIKKTNADVKLILVTNGHLSEPYVKELLPYIDAMNIDLKSFSDDFYKKMGGDFSLVKLFISEAVKHCHVELTYLLIPNLNDTPEEIEATARWIASLDCTGGTKSAGFRGSSSSIGKSPMASGDDIALHISRFFPTYKLTDRPPTSPAAVYDAVELAKKHLKWVYPGNC